MNPDNNCPNCEGIHHENNPCYPKMRISVLERKLAEKINEVERLRELLNRAIELAEKLEKEGLSASQLIDLHNEIDAVKELARLAPAPEEACKHEPPNLMRLGDHWHWCSRCGAARRLVEGRPFGNWQVPEAAELMREFSDFCDASLGNTADWPMEAKFDNENDCDKFCALLNEMKRIVNPLAITL